MKRAKADVGLLDRREGGEAWLMPGGYVRSSGQISWDLRCWTFGIRTLLDEGGFKSHGMAPLGR